jgi:hypothetical protein
MPIDLQALEEIKQLKYRYLRCVDRKQWAELRDTLAEDATSSYGGGKYSFTGRDHILAFLEKSMASTKFLSSHTVHQPEITFESAARAKGIWALHDTVINLEQGWTLNGSAFYEDTYVKGADGKWRIQHTGYTRTYEEVSLRAKTGAKVTDSYWGERELKWEPV